MTHDLDSGHLQTLFQMTPNSIKSPLAEDIYLLRIDQDVGILADLERL